MQKLIHKLPKCFANCELQTANLNPVRQWSNKWQVVSMSKPQLRIGLSESRKSCLNLWLQRWLKPRRNLVRFVTLNRFVYTVPFCTIITEGKKGFLKKLCWKWKRGIFLHNLAYVLTLLFWMGGSCFEKTAFVLPFLLEVSCFVIILAEMKDLYESFKLITFFSNSMRKSWLLVTKLGVCITLGYHLHHEQ